MKPRVYKILRASEWSVLQESGVFTGSDDDQRDGFIHLSHLEQVAGTLARHFAGEADLRILEVDSELLGSALKFEVSRGGALFPHLFRPLSRSEVTRVMTPEEFLAQRDPSSA